MISSFISSFYTVATADYRVSSFLVNSCRKYNNHFCICEI